MNDCIYCYEDKVNSVIYEKEYNYNIYINDDKLVFNKFVGTKNKFLPYLW